MPHDQMPVLNPNIPWKWQWDGVIARIANQRLVNLVKQLKLPTVDIFGAVQLDDVYIVDGDNHRVIQLAIEHLIATGVKHIGYCGVPGLTFSDQREELFAQHPTTPDVTQHIYQTPLPRRDPLQSEDQRWLNDMRAIRGWLEDLPKPVGIVACNDTRARHVIEACMAAGINVPRDVSVIGIDNDDVSCSLCTPTLSSVDPNAEAIGFRAAQILDGLMNHQAPPQNVTLIQPLGVERRESTNTESFEDQAMAAAIRYVRDHCDRGIDVNDVVKAVGISRSTIERRFRRHMNCTLHDYIHEMRMQRVCRLLLETNYPVANIATMTGFNNSSYFGATFRKHVGMTPGQFRREHTGE